MIAEIASLKDRIAELCRRFDVVRLEVFGSAARGDDFDPALSDVDFLVSFGPPRRRSFVDVEDFREALEALIGRRVDVVERELIETSDNPYRRRSILGDAEVIYG